MVTPELSRGTVEWEAARVAAAFGVGEWDGDTSHDKRSIFWGDGNEFQLSFAILKDGSNWYSVSVNELDLSYTNVFYNSPFWNLRKDGDPHLEFMARGLYRLGFTDESILQQLPTLSAHEKLELRLSMPREFWPEGWLETP